jgi:hypothetical protein
MNSWRPNKPERARAVFINCPFDPDYRPLFRAMCFTIIDCGYVPRCALDFSDSGQSRFHKILDLIMACGMSIHDISRVQLDVGTNLPRFNMPLELGADLGLRIKGPARQRNRRLLILETQEHRYDITASDLSGQDIEAHHDRDDEVIARVRDWLNAGHDGVKPLPGANAIQADYQNYRLAVPSLIEAESLDPYERLPHPDFLWTVYAALAEMERERAMTER